MKFEFNAGTVLVVDDDPSTLRGLARLLRASSYVVWAYSSALELLSRALPEGAACVLLDLRMPVMDGLQLQEALCRLGRSWPIVFMSGDPDVPATIQALKAGAVDFLLKPFEEAQLLTAIGEAMDKSNRVHAFLQEQRHARALFAALTRRESEVAHLVARGLLNKQIAWELRTCEKTIKVHRGRAMRKLQVTSVADLVRLAGYAL